MQALLIDKKGFHKWMLVDYPPPPKLFILEHRIGPAGFRHAIKAPIGPVSKTVVFARSLSDALSSNGLVRYHEEF